VYNKEQKQRNGSKLAMQRHTDKMEKLDKAIAVYKEQMEKFLEKL